MRRQHAAIPAIIAVSALTLSCGVSSSFLSDSERSSLYSVTLKSIDGKAIVDGSIVSPGSKIVAAIAKLPGASDPAAMEVKLESGSANTAAGLRVQTSGFKRSETAAPSAAAGAATILSTNVSTIVSTIVEKIEGSLPALVVPSSIAAGTFKIAATVMGADGAVLQSSQVVVFVGAAQPVIESVTSFPPSVEPGAPVLLGLSISRAAEEGAAVPADSPWDPWIVWSADGKAFAEGLLSSGLDEIVWQAPRAAGAYSVAAQVYPAAPLRGKGFSFRAAARQDVRVMAIASPGGSGDDFADSLSFLCLLRLDGDFSDSGTRPRISQPEAFGSPRLDVYSSGFGYRLDASAGIHIPELMPPAQAGRLLPFSVLVRLDPDQGDGALARFASDDGTYSLVIGLKDWKPYAEFSFDGKVQRSTAAAVAPRSPMTLEAAFRPDGERLEISWRAEGERIESPSIPLPPAPPAGAAPGSGARLGGPLSLPGVYDGFGLSAGAPSPAFRLAARRRWKAALVLAEGFEDGKLPRLSLPAGGASAASGSLVLGPGASLSLDPAFDPAAGVAVEASIVGDRASARLDFAAASGARIFSVSGTGEVLDAEGRRLGSVDARSGRLAFGVYSADGGYLVSSGEASSVDVSGDRSALALSIRREGGTDALAIESILARRASVPAPARR
jgi:hypothetical protein